MKKKNLIVLLLIAVIGIVGLTVAYFSNSTSLDNTFVTNPYGNTFTETFVAPTNWLPGDTTTKQIIATNTGSVDQAVRISLTETWTPSNSNSTLNGWIHPDGTKSNHTTENELATDVRAAVINFTNNSDWTKVGDYYYYNYKLAPTESTSTLIDSVTFNSKTKLDDTCVTTQGNGTKTVTCNSTGDGYDGATYTLTFKVETVQYDKYMEAWSTNVSVLAEKPNPLTMQEFIESATNPAYTVYDVNNATTKGKMFYFTHTLNEGTENEEIITDYRYIGDEPKNYVYFNCDDIDNQSASTCETWRILGVFDVERNDPEHQGQTITEQRMKLVRGNELANPMAFNLINNETNNDWTISSLNSFLNGDYYSGTATNGLKEPARGIIDEAKYYLGASEYAGVTTEQLYANERGTTVCGACNSDVNKLTWNGVVGLMYPSDEYMVYRNGVNEKCYNRPSSCGNLNDMSATGWIRNSNVRDGQTSTWNTWLLTSTSGKSNGVLFAAGVGDLRDSKLGEVRNAGVRPVVYLKTDIKITDGTGQENDPYKLGL